MTPFTFRTATEIVFGRGEAARAAGRIAAFGTSILLVHGANAARADWLAADLEAQGCRLLRLVAASEPDLDLIEDGLSQARHFRPDCVVALGGGSVMDTGKALAGLVPAPRPVMDHLEVVGAGLPLDVAPLPFIAIPTTSGTGAEVTRNAVIGVPSHRRKVSLRDPRMLAALAIVDPALTDGTGRTVTLDSGLDAITQLIEPFVSSRANPVTDALCRAAIPPALAAIVRLMQGEDEQARDAMAFASLSGGLALANAGLGVIHGLAGPLGGLAPAPHGAICGVLLPHGIRQNRAAVTDPAMRARFDVVLGWLADAMQTEAETALDAFVAWSASSGLRPLSALGLTKEDCALAADAALQSSSMKANPVALDRRALLAIMDQAF